MKRQHREVKESEKINRINCKKIIWICIFCWMLVIFLFSSQNADDSGDLSEGLLRNLILWMLPDHVNQNTIDILEHLLRKCAHMTEYAILAILVSIQINLYQWFQREWKKIFAAVSFVMLYAMTDEFHQLFVSGRSGRITDVLIDTCGGFIGALLISICFKIKQKNKFL